MVYVEHDITNIVCTVSLRWRSDFRSGACSKVEQHATARLIALLMEIDSRKLYAGQGYSSLFTYCMQRLHLSEHAAYLRIEAARSARRFPAILEKISDGSVHLTAVSLLGPHLTDGTHVTLLDAATDKSKREIEQFIASLRPQPDVSTVIRKLPTRPPIAVARSEVPIPIPAQDARCVNTQATGLATVPSNVSATKPPEIKPLAPERYKVQFTVSRETHDKLRRVQELMRHTIPDGDPAAIFDRALTLLLADLSRTKCGATTRPRDGQAPRSGSRHIPATVKRAVWQRDAGRCAFEGDHGRCGETGFLEFHHVVPYADGGETSVNNIQLRCRTHNQYVAQKWTGELWPGQLRETRPHFGT